MKTLVFITITLLSFTKIVAQNDTIWFNNSWKKTTKEQAEFYRPTPKKVGDLFLVKDYYINDNLQMQCYSLELETMLYHGTTTWYQEDGSILKQATYKNNRLHGKLISFDNKKEYVAEFKDGEIVKGSIKYQHANIIEIINYKNYLKTKQSYFFTRPKMQLQQQIFYDSLNNYSQNNKQLLKKFYDKNGTYIGQLTYNGYSPITGVDVSYHSLGNNIESITHYSNTKITSSNMYYRNGEPRILQTKNPTKISFYDTKGKTLGELYYKNNKKYNGTLISFFSLYKDDPEGVIDQKTTYALGAVVKKESFYANGQLKVEKIFNSETNYIEKETSYLENGELIGALEYKGIYPENGIRIEKNFKEWYKNGKLIKLIKYYHKTDLVFSKQELDKVTYFSKDQSVLGVLEIDSSATYLKPLNGKEIIFNGKFISSIKEYKDAFLLKETNTIYNSDNEKHFKTTTFYNQKSNRTREIRYFSNGNKQSDFNYKGGLVKFYDKDENQISTYDFNTKTGTLYDYFNNSDQINKITSRKNGEIITEKVFKKKYLPNKEAIYVLIRDVDVHNEGKFFDKNGNLVYSVTYKDEKPFNGVYYDIISREAFTYKNGIKEGAYKRFNYSNFPNRVIISGNYNHNNRNGIFTYTDVDNTIQKTVTYKEDKLEGKATFYDDNGKISSTLIYKDNKPFKGEVISVINKKRNENEILSYNNGKLISEVKHLETGTVEKLFLPEYTQITFYYPNSKVKKYRLQDIGDGILNGNVIRYNKANKEMHSAVLESGKLISGELWITPKYNHLFKRVRYFKIIKNDTLFSISMYNSENEVIFHSSEEPSLGASIINRLNLDIDYIEVSRLY